MEHPLPTIQATDEFPLDRVQLTPLGEDRVGIANFPMSWIGGPDHLVELMGAQPEAPADALGEQGHVVDVVWSANLLDG